MGAQTTLKDLLGHQGDAARIAAQVDRLAGGRTQFGYGFCEERFSGPCSTLEEAIAEARGERPEATHAWVGEVRLPSEFISTLSLGRSIEEHISEVLGDEVGEAAENFVLDQEQRTQLGQLVIDWIEKGPGFHCWGVKNVKQVELNPEERDTRTVDMFPVQEGGAA